MSDHLSEDRTPPFSTGDQLPLSRGAAKRSIEYSRSADACQCPYDQRQCRILDLKLLADEPGLEELLNLNSELARLRAACRNSQNFESYRTINWLIQ